MASVTTNYGFDVPTSSDLVKNGATQIALLGQDLDTFLFRPFTKNVVTNSAFQIWQRGTSFTAGTIALYTADRWQSYRGALGSTITRQATNDTTNLPNIQYCARIARDSGNTSTSQIFYSQSLESVNSIPLAGQQVTVSFYARAGANYSMASSALGFQLTSGTGTDQNIVSGFTGGSNIVNTTVTLTSTWQRFTRTVTVPTTSTQLALNYYFTPVGTAGANDYFEITGVMLEVGSQVSPFTTATGTIQGELAACQRYYWRSTVGDSSSRWAFGSAYSTTQAQFVIGMKQSMRVKPSAIDYGGTISVYDGVTPTNITALFLDQASTDFVRLTNTVASGLTQYRPYELTANASATAYIGFTAELQEMTMDNIIFITIDEVEHAIIDRGNGEFTSMPKATYDELKANEAKTI